MEEKNNANHRPNGENSGQDDRSVPHRRKHIDETVQDTVSFSDGADMIDDTDISGKRAVSTTSPAIDGSQGKEETELPLVGKRPRASFENSSLPDPDAIDDHSEDRIRKAGPDAAVELDEALIDRKTSLDDAEIGASEFGLSLESEDETIPESMIIDTEPDIQPADTSPEDSSRAGAGIPDPVELDADLDFPEVLIAIHDDGSIEPAVDTGQDSALPDIKGASDSEIKKEHLPKDDIRTADGHPVGPHDGEPGVAPTEEASQSDATLARRLTHFLQRQLSISMMSLFLVVLLTAAVFAAFLLGMRGPYLKPQRAPAKTTPQGVVVDATQTISGILHNDTEGPVFVIKGRVKNTSQEVIHKVRVTGRLFNQWKFFRKETVSGGSWLSDAELKQMDAANIRKRLSDHDDRDAPKLTIPPGHDIPFLIVFFHLPHDLGQLDRFTVEIARDADR